jgi:hypothetical protein
VADDPHGEVVGVSVVTRGEWRLRLSHVLAVSAALATVAAVRAGSLGLATGVCGVLLLGIGLYGGSRGAVTLAGVVLFAATVLVAAGPGGLTATLVGAFGAVLAADFGTFALGVGRDVDASVATTRVEALHAVGSFTVALLAGGLGYALFRVVPTGSTIGVVALLFAAVVLAAVLRS